MERRQNAAGLAFKCSDGSQSRYRACLARAKVAATFVARESEVIVMERLTFGADEVIECGGGSSSDYSNLQRRPSRLAQEDSRSARKVGVVNWSRQRPGYARGT